MKEIANQKNKKEKEIKKRRKVAGDRFGPA
jgi:hypothetical protein